MTTVPEQPIPGAARLLVTRALVIAGLSALAVVQPLLDLFGNNPEFFVAGNYTAGQIVWFAVAVAVVPPLVGIAVVAVVTAADRRAGTVAFAVVAGLFGAAFVLALLRSAGLAALVAVVVLAVAGGTAVSGLVLRTTGGRLLASYLAAANLLFVGLFLFASPTADLVSGAGTTDWGMVSLPPPTAPVVVIVLDEFPAATIMRADGTINDERYPGFAALAEVSTWFRNASSVENLTHRAVPSILDGRLAEEGTLPVFADHPRNLFTLLGGAMPVRRYESVTDMCPEAICAPGEPQPLSRALEDASIVYGHRVLPEALRDGLPAIDNSWGAYGAQDDAGTAPPAGDSPSYIEQAYSRWRALGADERSPRGQAAVLGRAIDAITADPALHFVHVALPHRPWVLSRTGVATSFAPTLIRDAADPAYDFENRMEFQFHAMQAGAADALVGQLVDHLRALPNWRDTLLVVTSDHGSNLTPPDLGRMRITARNVDEALRVPLFIKAPGQTTGEVRDDSVLNLDVLPSIVDLLDADVDWEFDGHSLYDGSAATVEPRVAPGVDAVIAIARHRAAEFPHGDDWIALAAVGDNGDLVGRPVADLDVGTPSALTIIVDQAGQLADLPTAAGEMPFGLSGVVASDAPPPELVVAVNGRLAGVLGGYRPAGSGWAFLGYVADLYQPGANRLDVYEVTREDAGATLHLVAQPDAEQA